MRRAKKVEIKRERRAGKVRAKIHGTKKRPRLCVVRTNNQMYVQLIDDDKGKTLASASFKNLKDVAAKEAGVSKAFNLGKMIGEEAGKVGVKEAVFDRGRRAYHGRVKALADGAREAGLKI